MDSHAVRTSTAARQLDRRDVTLNPATGSYVKLNGLPTSAPSIVDALWNDNGTVKILSG